MKKTKVLFVVENLKAGGAERVLVNLVNHLSPEKFDVTVLTIFEKGVHFSSLAPHVHAVCRNAKFFRGMSYFMRLIPSRLLYKHYVKDEDFDVVVAYMTGIPTKVVAGAKKSKRIGWLHGDMRCVFVSKKLYWSNRHYRKTYEKFDAVFGCADTVTDSFRDKIGANCKQIRTVYNVNDTPRILSQATAPVELPFESDMNIPVFSTMGSLLPVKGFERLIRICGRLKDKGFRFRLLLIGDGPLREQLSALVSELALEDTVFLVGFQKNPYPYISASDVFVCSSFSEGLSTAVSESIVLGRAVVSTEVSGAYEILGKNNEYGIVVENHDDALYAGMKNFLENPEQISYYQEKAQERSKFFMLSHVISENEEAIQSVLE